MRISKDAYYLNIADAVSLRSTCLKHRYGAVIVKNDRIVSTGYNGSPRGHGNCCDVLESCSRIGAKPLDGDYTDCPAVHAEQNALLNASREDLEGAILYLYSSKRGEVKPCLICQRMINNSGIKKVVTSQSVHNI